MDTQWLIEIGSRIQARRKQMGFTQEQLAAMMDVSVQMVSNLERGNKAIRIDNLVRLCEALNTSADFILTGSAAPHSADSLAKQLAALPRAQDERIEALAAYCLAHPT